MNKFYLKMAKIMIFPVYDFQPRGAAANLIETHDQGSSSLQQVPRGQHSPGHWGGGEADPDQVSQPGDNLQQVGPWSCGHLDSLLIYLSFTVWQWEISSRLTTSLATG